MALQWFASSLYRFAQPCPKILIDLMAEKLSVINCIFFFRFSKLIIAQLANLFLNVENIEFKILDLLKDLPYKGYSKEFI